MLTVAATDSTRRVESVTLAIVVPSGTPTPTTRIPTTRPFVLSSVIVVEVVAAAVSVFIESAVV